MKKSHTKQRKSQVRKSRRRSTNVLEPNARNLEDGLPDDPDQINLGKNAETVTKNPVKKKPYKGMITLAQDVERFEIPHKHLRHLILSKIIKCEKKTKDGQFL